jgi:hypothetical protein
LLKAVILGLISLFHDNRGHIERGKAGFTGDAKAELAECVRLKDGVYCFVVLVYLRKFEHLI